MGKEKEETKTYEQKLKEVLDKIKEKKDIAETYVASVVYCRPEYLQEEKLDIELFSNNEWKVYYIIASEIVLTEKKKKLDDITIGIYLQNHDNLRKMYNDYGGYQTILTAKGYTDPENYEGFVSDLKKWDCILKLIKKGFPIIDRLSDFMDMTSEQIFNEYESVLSHVFTQSDEIKSYNIFENMKEYVDSCDRCEEIGLPFYNSPLITDETGGLKLGEICGIGANSGVGKSTLAFNWIIPSAIDCNEKVVFIINEEDERKFQRELLIWVVNNQIRKDKKPINKKTLRNGKFTPDIKEAFYQAAEWIDKRKDERIFTVVPLDKYTVGKAIRIINKYKSLGVNTFVLDTFKESFDAKGETYNTMRRDMTMLYDTVKPKAKNVRLVVTYQLGKSSIRVRHYTNNDIGQAKNIVNEFSINIMARRPLEDEYDGGKKALKCYKFGENYKDTNERVEYKLLKEEYPMIVFIPKTRAGETDTKQIILKCDLGTNIIKDVGITIVPQDW